jgi:hypothetical protein
VQWSWKAPGANGRRIFITPLCFPLPTQWIQRIDNPSVLGTHMLFVLTSSSHRFLPSDRVFLKNAAAVGGQEALKPRLRLGRQEAFQGEEA